MKTILITGCSSGIGYHAAQTLKMKGWRVFATCRKESDCNRLKSEGFESFILDLFTVRARLVLALKYNPLSFSTRTSIEK